MSKEEVIEVELEATEELSEEELQLRAAKNAARRVRQNRLSSAAFWKKYKTVLTKKSSGHTHSDHEGHDHTHEDK